MLEKINNFTKKMSDKYHIWRDRAEKHDLNHNTDKRNGKIDFSCIICYPNGFIEKRFKRFWKWYKKLLPEVNTYTAKTAENFNEYLKEGNDFDLRKWDNKKTNRVRGKFEKLLGSMRYTEAPKVLEKEIWEKLIIITSASHKFEKKGMKIAVKNAEKY